MTTETVVVEQFIAAPPSRVWAALTRPDMLAKWWASGDIAPEVGHSFVMDMEKWGGVSCRVLESEPEKRFVYSFGDWTLTWILEGRTDGTLLRLEHSGFDLDKQGDRFAYDNMSEGWRSIVLPGLADLLSSETV